MFVSAARRSLRLSATLAGLFAIPAALLSGCGMGTTATPSTEAVHLGAIKGIVHGGPNPIVGATVKLYATQTVAGSSTNNYGYGQSSLLLAEANTIAGQNAGYDTDVNGFFTFTASSYVNACPAGQQVYAVVSGGNTGANAVNSSSLLISALGSCSSLYDSTGETWTGGVIWVNELTTIAAAYALNNFIGVNGAVVNISAPAANNGGTALATTGSTTAAVGLAHAFTVAGNLVNTSTGVVNPTVGSTALPGIVPVAFINTLGNILQYCVNSAGGTAGDASNCGKFYTAATVGTAVPANTLSALLNLVRNPNTNVATIYGFVSGMGFYQPSLSASTNLSDWSLMISFVSPNVTPTATSTGLYTPFHLALDANDEAFVDNYASTTVGSNLFGFNADGTLDFQTPYNATYFAPRMIAVDSNDAIYLANYGTGTGVALLRYTKSGGASQTPYKLTPGWSPYSVAVDASNTIWFSETGGGYIASTTFNTTTNVFTTSVARTSSSAPFEYGTTKAPAYGLMVDNNQNVWGTLYSTTASTPNMAFVIANTSGSASAPTYSTTSVYTATLAAGEGSYGISLDNSGTGYMTTGSTSIGLTPITPAVTAGVVTGLAAGTTVASGTSGAPTTTYTYGGPVYPNTDGDGNIWTGDYGNKGTIDRYVPSSGSLFTFHPCYLATATTQTCATAATSALYGPRVAQVDSAGNVWAANYYGYSVTEIIGAGAPSWPLIATGKLGQRPY